MKPHKFAMPNFMTNRIYRIVFCVGISAIILACLLRFGLFNTPNLIRTNVSSMLTDTLDIAELSTAEFKYRGIADIYTDDSRTKIRCRVCYDAIVKAGINMQDVVFDVDDSNRTVAVTLPNIDLKVITKDEQSMKLLPSNADVEIDAILKYSKEDAENEARQSEGLMKTAEENIKAVIEGLLYPLLSTQGYTLVWN